VGVSFFFGFGVATAAAAAGSTTMSGNLFCRFFDSRFLGCRLGLCGHGLRLRFWLFRRGLRLDGLAGVLRLFDDLDLRGRLGSLGRGLLGCVDFLVLFVLCDRFRQACVIPLSRSFWTVRMRAISRLACRRRALFSSTPVAVWKWRLNGSGASRPS
jgi:hypothetical protein